MQASISWTFSGVASGFGIKPTGLLLGFDRYNAFMITESPGIVDEVLGPVARCFTPEVARKITLLRAGRRLQARLDSLAQRANEGELTEAERDQYEAYVEWIDIVSILQAQARKILAANKLP